MSMAPADPPSKLTALAETLARATEAIEAMADDPLLRRLLDAFRQLPAEDRPVITKAIEREAHARRLSRATEGVTGQTMHPNPHARLYLRAHEQAVPRGMLERDELMLAMLRAFRVVQILTVPEIHAEWIEATREALGHVDAPTRAVIDVLLRDVQALVAELGTSETPHAKAS